MGIEGTRLERLDERRYMKWLSKTLVRGASRSKLIVSTSAEAQLSHGGCASECCSSHILSLDPTPLPIES